MKWKEKEQEKTFLKVPYLFSKNLQVTNRAFNFLSFSFVGSF